jgi:hypothetical protein
MDHSHHIYRVSSKISLRSIAIIEVNGHTQRIHHLEQSLYLPRAEVKTKIKKKFIHYHSKLDSKPQILFRIGV